MATEPAPLLSSKDADYCLRNGCPNLAEVRAIATSRVACYDTSTHVAVQKMTVEESSALVVKRAKPAADWEPHTEERAPWMAGYLAALRDAGVIR